MLEQEHDSLNEQDPFKKTKKTGNGNRIIGLKIKA